MRYRGYGSSGFGIVGYVIITCVVIFIATLISPRLVSVLEFYPPLFAQRPWTIVTSLFTHYDFFHIFFNMLVLYFFGGFLVSLVGDRWFLAIYLLGGMAGNLFFWSLGYGAVLGASGAIFAVEGTLVIMRPRLQVYIFPIPAAIPLWVAVIGAFLLTYFAGGNIAWQAHLGGLFFGLLAGLYFRFRETRRFF